MLFLPSRRMLLALAAGAAILAALPTVGLAVNAGLILLFFLDALAVRRMGLPELNVSIRTRMGQGDEDAARIELANRSGRRLEVVAALDVPPTLAGEGAWEARKVSLAPGERVEVAFPIAAHQRGEHVLRGFHLRIRGPLQLAWWQAEKRLDRAVQVIPGLREIRSYRLLAVHHHLHQAGLRFVRMRGEGGSFESLREYVRGDDTRHMDWKASARRGTLIVKQYEAERSQNIMLCIDTGRWMAEEIAGAARLDKALAAAVVLSEVARVWNDHVGVLAFSDRIHVLLPPARQRPDRIAETFVGLEARSVEPDYPRALTRLSRVIHRRSLLIFFGDVIDDEVSGPLAAQLARLCRRHLPLFLALRNVDLFKAAVAPVTDRESACRRAAAAELVLARARTLARMRDRGILVADIHPDSAVATAVNRYLEIKRHGVL